MYLVSLHASYWFSERYIKCQFEIQQMWMDSNSLQIAEVCMQLSPVYYQTRLFET